MDDILKTAAEENYAAAAPNIWNLETIKASVKTAEKLKSPIILDYGEGDYDVNYSEIAVLAEYYARNTDIPVALNLDHGLEFKNIVLAIKAGFSSVMIDRSQRPFEENVRDTKKICEIAHAADVSVEAELGHVGSGTDRGDRSSFTKVDEAKTFVEETGVDCLAVAVGTAHGHYQGTPKIDFERISKIRESIDVPLVLHGGSSTGDTALKKAVKHG
ncbi:MAG: class II fructose-bisphosphate aldolase, partial [Bacillota bacterium]